MVKNWYIHFFAWLLSLVIFSTHAYAEQAGVLGWLWKFLKTEKPSESPEFVDPFTKNVPAASQANKNPYQEFVKNNVKPKNENSELSQVLVDYIFTEREIIAEENAIVGIREKVDAELTQNAILMEETARKRKISQLGSKNFSRRAQLGGDPGKRLDNLWDLMRKIGVRVSPATPEEKKEYQKFLSILEEYVRDVRPPSVVMCDVKPFAFHKIAESPKELIDALRTTPYFPPARDGVPSRLSVGTEVYRAISEQEFAQLVTQGYITPWSARVAAGEQMSAEVIAERAAAYARMSKLSPGDFDLISRISAAGGTGLVSTEGLKFKDVLNGTDIQPYLNVSQTPVLPMKYVGEPSSGSVCVIKIKISADIDSIVNANSVVIAGNSELEVFLPYIDLKDVEVFHVASKEHEGLVKKLVDAAKNGSSHHPPRPELLGLFIPQFQCLQNLRVLVGH